MRITFDGTGDVIVITGGGKRNWPGTCDRSHATWVHASWCAMSIKRR